HFQVVIGFDQQAITAAQMIFHIVGKIAKVGDYADFYAFGREGEAAWISRIVGNGKWTDRDVADGKTVAGLKMLAALNAAGLAIFIAVRSARAVVGGLGHIDRNFQLAG